MERWRPGAALVVFTIVNVGIFFSLYDMSQRTVSSVDFKNSYQQRIYAHKENAEMSKVRASGRDCLPLKNKTSFLIQPWRLASKYCENSKCVKNKKVNWTMVFFVKSAGPNQVRRELLRRTWASLSYVEGGRFETVFVIGKTNVPKYVSLLNEEHKRYGDLLQFNDFDDYEHIGLKTLAGMQWAADNLPVNYLYSSVDDDFMVNLGKLQESVEENLRNMIELSLPMFPIICGFTRGANEKPIRQEGYKWTVALDVYKWPDYPPYCHGGLYTTSVAVVEDLFHASRTEKTFHLDDVWITGVLRHKIGMPDTMLVKAKDGTGLHYSGYRGKQKDGVRNFMKEEWEDCIKLFNTTKILCTCLK
ncbi:beta-1,3-galactosyltransferase 5-like [Clavelina lepadiformis]|uniref:beta-1,3-galactosyltransferase 5-like n=1 Tax=Clavelina lepadiformis TaxID=159417 RepID=UPI004042F768